MSIHQFRKFPFAILAAIFVITMTGNRSEGAEPQETERETRVFKVSVDGKERGQCTMQIAERDDGSEKMHIDASLTFDYVVYVYRYHSTGTEVWKDDRLVELTNMADLNKTKYKLQGKASPKGLRLSVDGKKSDFAREVWATSYWRLPNRLAHHDEKPKSEVVQAEARKETADKKPMKISLLDSDKGTPLNGEFRYVGNEYLTVAGKRESCQHYRIGGDVQVELWYDANGRLVRQEGVESGHKTVLELTKKTAE